MKNTQLLCLNVLSCVELDKNGNLGFLSTYRTATLTLDVLQTRGRRIEGSPPPDQKAKKQNLEQRYIANNTFLPGLYTINGTISVTTILIYQ